MLDEETKSLARSIVSDRGLRSDDHLFWMDAVDDVLIVAITDPEGTILYANHKFCMISGYSKDELVGENHRILNSGTHNSAFFGDMFRTIKAGRTWRGEICNRAKSGKLYWVATTIIPRLDEMGNVTHYVACRFDISEQKRAQQYLAQAAKTDALTGLLNRFAFQTLLEQKTKEIAATNERAAVALLDIDSFKDINDVYGHQMGDRLLKLVASRIVKAIGPKDQVARFGGDEIVLLFSDLSDEADLKSRLDALQRVIQMPLELGISHSNIYASIGVTVLPDDGMDVFDLLKKVDMALYSAKRLGRNRYEFYTDALKQAITKRVSLQEQARLGHLRQEFTLHYQPIMSVKTGAVESMEALLRWNHPTLGLITPGQFWEVFDDHRITAQLGNFVRETVVRQAAAWTSQGFKFGRIAINTTAADFARAGFTERLVADLEVNGLTPDVITIEVTEGMFLGKMASRIRQEIEGLHQAGFEIAFDDFGTGFASLTHLKELPLDRIKIDRSFVEGLEETDSDRKIVACIVDLAHNLDLTVTAEGIETLSQLEILTQMGCDKIQGYLVSKPLAASEIPAFCAAHNS